YPTEDPRERCAAHADLLLHQPPRRDAREGSRGTRSAGWLPCQCDVPESRCPWEQERSVAHCAPAPLPVCSPAATQTGRVRESMEDQLRGRSWSARANRASPQKKAHAAPADATKPDCVRLPPAIPSGFRCEDTL